MPEGYADALRLWPGLREACTAQRGERAERKGLGAVGTGALATGPAQGLTAGLLVWPHLPSPSRSWMFGFIHEMAPSLGFGNEAPSGRLAAGAPDGQPSPAVDVGPAG